MVQAGTSYGSAPEEALGWRNRSRAMVYTTVTNAPTLLAIEGSDLNVDTMTFMN